MCQRVFGIYKTPIDALGLTQCQINIFASDIAFGFFSAANSSNRAVSQSLHVFRSCAWSWFGLLLFY